MGNNVRLNLHLPQKSMDRLNILKDTTNKSSVTDVIKDAVMTYESIVEWLSDGATFFIRRPDGSTAEVKFIIDVDTNNNPPSPDLKAKRISAFASSPQIS